jgi:hypothetical protein
MDFGRRNTSTDLGRVCVYIYTNPYCKKTYAATVKNSQQQDDKTKNEQLWKKAEFVAGQAKEFFTDRRVESVIYMLDWSARAFTVHKISNDKVLFVHGPRSYARMSIGERFSLKYFQSSNYVIISGLSALTS